MKIKLLEMEREISEIQKKAKVIFGSQQLPISYEASRDEAIAIYDRAVPGPIPVPFPIHNVDKALWSLHTTRKPKSYLACFYYIWISGIIVEYALVQADKELAEGCLKMTKIYFKQIRSSENRRKKDAGFRKQKAIAAGFARAKNTEIVVTEAIRLLMLPESTGRWRFKGGAIEAIKKPLEKYISENEIGIKGGESLTDRLRIWSIKFSGLREAFENAKIKKLS